jgi:hypothetical protein
VENPPLTNPETRPQTATDPRAGLVRGRFSTHIFGFIVFLVILFFLMDFDWFWIRLVWFVCFWGFLHFLVLKLQIGIDFVFVGLSV